MRKFLEISFCFFFLANYAYAQHNMLGKSQKYIKSFYALSNEFALKVDSISQKSILLSFKTDKQYPFYTYEMDLQKDICVSYGIVSKDNSTLKAYLDMLDYFGELIEVDSAYHNFIYKIETNQRTSYFSIKQPYFDSQFLTRRGLFYILVTEQPRLLIDKIEENN